MASIRLRRTNEDGSKVYQIRAKRVRGQSQKSINWIAPAGWSQTAIDRKLSDIAGDLDRGVKAGEILTRAEQKAKEKAAAEEAAKIKTVRQYGDSIYIPGKEGECAYRTVEYYKATLERYIYPVIGDVKMVDVRPVVLKGIIQKAQNKGFSYSTVRGIFLTLSQLFDQANKDDVIEVNPMAKVNAPHRKKDAEKAERDIYTAAQLQTIRDALEHESLKWRTYFSIMMDTGARKGEICALKWDNVDFVKGTVKIDCNAVNMSDADSVGEKVVVTRPKNGKSRIVPISAESIQMLREMKLQSGRFDFVFVQIGIAANNKPVNKPLSPQSADYFLRKISARYGFNFKCHPHKFRHTVATMLLQNGVSLQDTAKLIGDNPETVARFYLHSTDDAVMKAGKILHKALGRA